jgi:uncharacterized UPF0146 family protein
MPPVRSITKSYYLDSDKQMIQKINWREQIRASVGHEAKLMESMNIAISKRFRNTADIVRDRGISVAIASTSRLLYDDSIFEPLMKMYMDVSIYYAKRTYRELLNRQESTTKGLKMPTEWKTITRFEPIWRDAINTFLRQHGVTFVGDINETTRKDLLRILSNAANANAKESEVVSLLVKSSIPLIRATRIARTEVTRALNAGILLAAATVPFETYKEWLTAEDEKVRGRPFSHLALHGTVLPLNQPFRNGEDIRFPGDPLASAENVINCRCVLNILPNLDPLGRPIMREQNILDTDILFRLTDLF